MKKLLVIVLAFLMLPVMPVMAQGKKKNSKEMSPYIEGRKKVRIADYDSVWMFTTFNNKQRYFCRFDYSKFPAVLEARRPQFGTFEPVMNYLIRNPRSSMRICAVYAINPSIRDAAQKNSLRELARPEALEALEALQGRMKEEHMKNKLQLSVAEVDYRYWQGPEFFTTEQTSDPLIHVGLILYFGTKKLDLFPNSAAGAQTFKDIKFFPNDATVQESWYSHIDALAKYLKDNDRLEVLLTGYSDNQGTDAYKKGLSMQRATEVKKLLMARGVEEIRIEIDGRGSEDPVGDNNTYEGRVANNRCSITIQ